MEKTKDTIKNTIKEKEELVNDKKTKGIFGFSIWRILGYFVIYSILGYIIETIFGAVTKGIIESRKSFLYGPFCGIYGIGAIIMILGLQAFKKNNNTLFWGGFFIGSVVEYVVSLIGELIFHVIWWDYSDMPLNLNGRVCVFFSIFWGLLGIYLVSYVNPKIDKLINFIKIKISNKALKILEIAVVIFLLFDCMITGYALKVFFIRMVKENNIDIGDREKIEQVYEEIYNDENVSNFIYKHFGNEKMIKTFPNLKLQDNNGNIVYFDSLLPDIQPYYLKFSDKGIKEKIVKDVGILYDKNK